MMVKMNVSMTPCQVGLVLHKLVKPINSPSLTRLLWLVDIICQVYRRLLGFLTKPNNVKDLSDIFMLG